MNFLGHCYLCQNHPHLITGNLAGDFYKGNLSNHTHLSISMQQGVKFHRFIDDFTDQSEQISAVAHLFQKNGISKVSYIGCDILLDHYLSNHWKEYSEVSYTDFIREIYQQVDLHLGETTDEFQFLYEKMKEYGWFFDYPTLSGITKILHQFSTRIPFENNLENCAEIYQTHQTEIEKYFKAFLISIKEQSSRFILDQKLDIP